MLTVDEIDAIADDWIEGRDSSAAMSERDMDISKLCASHKEALAELGQLQAEFDGCRPYLKEDIGETVPECIERNRKDIDALMALYGKALERAERAEAALRNLVAKLDAIEPHVSNVCAIAQIHGVPYAGPNWADEIAAARAVLAQKG